VPSHSGAGSKPELADRVKAILAAKQLTLHQASQISAKLFGRVSPYYLPHNLYYDLSHGHFSPSLFQLVAFSRISDYRLRDWLKIFGFDIEAIPRLQIQLPAKRTALLDSSLDDPESSIPWLREVGKQMVRGDLVPLSQLIEWTEGRRLGSLQELNDRNSVYARIGGEDAMAFPELLPGSIVRANSEKIEESLNQVTAEGSRHLFLIQHNRGLCCCHIRIAGRERIAIVSTELPYAQVEFKVPEEARIVGVVDLEIRSLLRMEPPSVASTLRKQWKPEKLASEPSQLGLLLQKSRLRMGLSFRAAAQISRELAKLMGDDRYFAAQGSLSDYETLDTPPRHFHKIVTFSAIYHIRLNAIFKALGFNLENATHEPIPQLLTGGPASVGSAAEMESMEKSGFVEELIAQFDGTPFFLSSSLNALSDLRRISLKDLFWLGCAGESVHPSLSGGILAIVNRQKKKPDDCGSKPLWQQPLYLLMTRDGTHRVGCCSRENSSLIVHTYPAGAHKREQFRDRDVEVVGKIVTIARRLV
jgi:hypothetical protein